MTEAPCHESVAQPLLATQTSAGDCVAAGLPPLIATTTAALVARVVPSAADRTPCPVGDRSHGHRTSALVALRSDRRTAGEEPVVGSREADIRWCGQAAVVAAVAAAAAAAADATAAAVDVHTRCRRQVDPSSDQVAPDAQPTCGWRSGDRNPRDLQDSQEQRLQPRASVRHSGCDCPVPRGADGAAHESAAAAEEVAAAAAVVVEEVVGAGKSADAANVQDAGRSCRGRRWEQPAFLPTRRWERIARTTAAAERRTQLARKTASAEDAIAGHKLLNLHWRTWEAAVAAVLDCTRDQEPTSRQEGVRVTRTRDAVGVAGAAAAAAVAGETDAATVLEEDVVQEDAVREDAGEAAAAAAAAAADRKWDQRRSPARKLGCRGSHSAAAVVRSRTEAAQERTAEPVAGSGSSRCSQEEERTVSHGSPRGRHARRAACDCSRSCWREQSVRWASVRPACERRWHGVRVRAGAHGDAVAAAAAAAARDGGSEVADRREGRRQQPACHPGSWGQEWWEAWSEAAAGTEGREVVGCLVAFRRRRDPEPRDCRRSRQVAPAATERRVAGDRRTLVRSRCTERREERRTAEAAPAGRAAAAAGRQQSRCRRQRTRGSGFQT